MEKQYKTTELIVNGGKVIIHDPALTEEAQEARQKRFEKACATFMAKVYRQRAEQKEKELAATSSTKQK